MAFIRKKNINGEDYYYYVENYKKKEKVIQKNLKYIGKNEPDKNLLKELEEEFTEKKIQKLIRTKIEFEPYKVDTNFLKKCDQVKQYFFNNLSTLSKEGKKQLINRFKTGFTYHSCSIEGNTLSRNQVDMVINKKESIDGKKLFELQEVKNHNKAIEYMLSENSDLSELFIKKLHEVLMKDILEYKEDDQNFVIGGYRCDQRFIEGADFIPIPPILIPFEMKELITFYKKNKYIIHPIELASEIHLKFAIIHPFSDGNGRMARLIMNFILDRSGFPMIDISVKNREKYIHALSTGNSKNLTLFIYEELKNYVKHLFQNSLENNFY